MLERLPQRIRDKIRLAPCPVKSLKGECWIWTACKHWKGYGFVGWEGKSRYSHIVVFLLSGRKIPKGKQLDHLCRVTACCNPHHLEAVTHRENTLRGNTVTGDNYRKTHCVRGHPLTNIQLRVNKSGHVSRVCRLCRRLYAKNARRESDSGICITGKH